MNILATQRLFYTHGLETLIIIAILFTIIGYFIGWLTWRHCRVQAERVERMNVELRKRYDDLSSEQGKLDRILEDLI